MNLTTWNPISVIVVLVVALPPVTFALIAIINAIRGNAAAAQEAANSMRGIAQQAAIDALDKTGLPRQVTALGAQVNQIAMQTPPPPQTTVIIPPQAPPTEKSP